MYRDKICINTFIINKVTNNNLHPHVDNDKIHQLVKESNINSEESIEKHQLYCVPSKTMEILWDKEVRFNDQNIELKKKILETLNITIRKVI